MTRAYLWSGTSGRKRRGSVRRREVAVQGARARTDGLAVAEELHQDVHHGARHVGVLDRALMHALHEHLPVLAAALQLLALRPHQLLLQHHHHLHARPAVISP